MSPDDVRSMLANYCAAYTDNDCDAWTSNFADDAWIEDPVGTPVLHGRAAIAQFFIDGHARYDSVELVLGSTMIVAGNEVAFRMQGRPVVRGQLFDIDIINVMTFDASGKIATMRAFFETAHRS